MLPLFFEQLQNSTLEWLATIQSLGTLYQARPNVLSFAHLSGLSLYLLFVYLTLTMSSKLIMETIPCVRLYILSALMRNTSVEQSIIGMINWLRPQKKARERNHRTHMNQPHLNSPLSTHFS
jgi:hypothetical protein